jgi:hypothetical protein
MVPAQTWPTTIGAAETPPRVGRVVDSGNLTVRRRLSKDF